MNANPGRQRVRVVKLGGSLLELDDLAARLETWFASQPPAANVLVVGGGRFVDLLREWDARRPVAAEAIHWLAVRAMGLTAALVGEMLPHAQARQRSTRCGWRKLEACRFSKSKRSCATTARPPIL